MKTVFICEDHPLFRKSLEQMINAADGLEFLGASVSVNESIEKISALRPDLVLLDLNLGGGDGFQVLQSVREYLPTTLVMILTSYDDSVLAKKAKRFGASAYMLKDSDEAILLQSIGQMRLGDFISNVKEFSEETAFESDKEFTSFLKLTRMEKKLVGVLQKGNSVAEAAQLLNVSENTIKNHKKNIYRKLGVNKQAELILLCQRNGLLER